MSTRTRLSALLARIGLPRPPIRSRPKCLWAVRVSRWCFCNSSVYVPFLRRRSESRARERSRESSLRMVRLGTPGERRFRSLALGATDDRFGADAFWEDLEDLRFLRVLDG